MSPADENNSTSISIQQKLTNMNSLNPAIFRRRAFGRRVIAACAILPAMWLASCESLIYDSEGDCETVYEIQFVYDRNLKWADAFSSEVGDVTLHVFEQASGIHVMSETISAEELTGNGNAVRLNIPPGDYQMLAWCGDGAHDNGYSFIPNVPTASRSAINEMKCRMTRNHVAGNEKGIVDQEKGLSHLYHGIIKASLPAEEGSKVRLVMPLTKNTNSVKVVLQSMKGTEIDPDDYDIFIEDNNGYMDYDNTLIDDEPLVYKPWSTTGGSAEILNPDYADIEAPGAAHDSGPEVMSAVVADLTVGRLMTKHRPILTVRDKGKGKNLFRIPINDYALMVKGHYKHKMDDQEYLDRQDEYNMTFFLDENGEWLNMYIYINKWKVVVSEHELD